MPPVDTSAWPHPGAHPGRPTATATAWPPPLIDPAALAHLPIPIQAMVATALLPYEVAITSVKILKNAEALLGEFVFHMNALRPATSALSQAYSQGQFDQVFRTIDTIQNGTNAIALVWAPLNAVRDRLVPTPPPPSPPGQHVPTRSPGYAPARPVAPVTITQAPPSTVEYLGRLGGQLWGRAASLPGVGYLPDVGTLPGVGTLVGAGLLRRPATLEEDPEPVTTPMSIGRRGIEAAREHAPDEDAPSPSLMSRAAPLVPGSIRRLFAG